jgi:hypothetical protein
MTNALAASTFATKVKTYIDSQQVNYTGHFVVAGKGATPVDTKDLVRALQTCRWRNYLKESLHLRKQNKKN